MTFNNADVWLTLKLSLTTVCREYSASYCIPVLQVKVGEKNICHRASCSPEQAAAM